MKKGDSIFFCSDGFPDQFGGPDGKKYKYRPFRNLLINICKLPMADQKDALKSALDEWKGDLPQLDDITVFGSRFA